MSSRKFPYNLKQYVVWKFLVKFILYTNVQCFSQNKFLCNVMIFLHLKAFLIFLEILFLVILNQWSKYILYVYVIYWIEQRLIEIVLECFVFTWLIVSFYNSQISEVPCWKRLILFIKKIFKLNIFSPVQVVRFVCCESCLWPHACLSLDNDLRWGIEWTLLKACFVELLLFYLFIGKRLMKFVDELFWLTSILYFRLWLKVRWNRLKECVF